MAREEIWWTPCPLAGSVLELMSSIFSEHELRRASSDPPCEVVNSRLFQVPGPFFCSGKTVLLLIIMITRMTTLGICKALLIFGTTLVSLVSLNPPLSLRDRCDHITTHFAYAAERWRAVLEVTLKRSFH